MDFYLLKMDNRYNANNTCLECGYSNDYHYDMDHEFIPIQDFNKEPEKNISLLLDTVKLEKIIEEESLSTSSDDENENET